MPILTPTDIATYLSTEFDTAQADRVQPLIDAVLAATETSLSYELTRSERTHLIDGGQRRVWLPEPPVAIDFTQDITISIFNDVTSLYDPYPFTRPPLLRSDASIDLYGVGYGPDAVQITYTAGWDNDALPADLKQALIELVAAKWSLATAVSTTSTSGTDARLKSITIGSLRQEFAIGAETTGVTAKLQTQATAALDTIQAYKRVRVF